MPLGIGGAVRRFTRQGNTDGPVAVRLTELNSMAVAEVELPGTEVLRAGRRFSAGHVNGATFQAQQTANPTTTAGLLIYNGEAGSNAKSYVVSNAIAYAAGGTTATGGLTLFGAVLPANGGYFTVPTTVAAGTGVTNLSGKAAVASNAKTALAAAVTAAATVWNWMPLATGAAVQLWEGVAASSSLAAALAVVPPGAALALSVVSAGGTTPTFGLSAIWDELELDLE